MHFTLLSDIDEIETIATNRGIRERERLRKQYGAGRWRKRKGVAFILLPDGTSRKAELHWYEATGIGRKEYKIKRFLDWRIDQLVVWNSYDSFISRAIQNASAVSSMGEGMSTQPAQTPRFAICIQNTEYPAALEVRKIYQVLPDDDAAQLQYLRVIDESGEDYLYPADYFLPIELPRPVQEAILRAA
jgi:hypothetical protein